MSHDPTTTANAPVARAVLYTRACEHLTAAATYARLAASVADKALERLKIYAAERPRDWADDAIYDDYAVKGAVELIVLGGEGCDATTRAGDKACLAADVDTLRARVAASEVLEGLDNAHRLLSYALLPFLVDFEKKPRKVMVFAADMDADAPEKVAL